MIRVVMIPAMRRRGSRSVGWILSGDGPDGRERSYCGVGRYATCQSFSGSSFMRRMGSVSGVSPRLMWGRSRVLGHRATAP